MPMDPYLARVTDELASIVDLGRAIAARQHAGMYGIDHKYGVELEVMARRELRRRQREWLRIERRFVAELGYMDLGGEA